MILLERISVMNFENAIRGARNPMNSWGRMDSTYDADGNFVLGENDRDLCRRLTRAGSDHRKFLRQIFVSVNITAPLYWWKEFDTYKVATVSNSTSTMHTLHKRPLTLDDFSHEQLDEWGKVTLQNAIRTINADRDMFVNYEDKTGTKMPKKHYWYQMIQLLPSSYNQLRTVTLNYEVLLNMYHARKDHKLDEWRKFCEVIAELPYFKDFIDKGD